MKYQLKPVGPQGDSAADHGIVAASRYGAAKAISASARDLAGYVGSVPPVSGAGGRRLRHLQIQIAAAEFIVASITAYLASAVYYYAVLLRWPPTEKYIPAALVIGALAVIAAGSFHHFGSIQTKPRHWFVASGIGSVALAFSFFLTGLFLCKLAEDYSRGTFVAQFVSVTLAVLIVRTLAHARLQAAIADGLIEARRAVLIGSDTHCAQVAARLRASGVKVVGTFPLPTAHADDASDANWRDGENFRRMLEQSRRLRPEDVLILAASEQLPAIPGLIERLSELPVALHLVPVGAGDLLATSKPAELGNVTTLQILHLPLSLLDQFLKRAFDIVLAAAGLVALSPLLLIVAAAIKLDSQGPVLFRQRRHGYNNETIGVFKFRSMITIEDGHKFTQAVKGDARVTRVGRLLRATNIDELPQLLNVLTGEMSIVGPRPHPIALNELFEEQIAPFSRRHNVKPGITGWAQVNGYRGQTDTLEKMQQRVECDLYYIDNWSFLFDMKIILMTLFTKRAYMNAC